VSSTQTWRRKYVPWLFLATLLGLLAGHAMGLRPPGGLTFRALQAAPLAVLGLWMALGAAASGVTRPGVKYWALYRHRPHFWGFCQLVLALILFAFALATLVGGPTSG